MFQTEKYNMRTLLFSLLFLFNYHSGLLNNRPVKYSVTIWDYNYSMSYTLFYHVSNDSLVVKRITGISNEKDSVIVKEKLSQKHCILFSKFLNTFKIDRLKSKYINPLVEDGDRKRVTIQIGPKIKTIEIANVYQKDIASLFDLTNQILPTDLKIIYNK
jgi:hypothetical protein